MIGRIREALSALKRQAYAGFGRDRWQQPDRVVQALGLKPGDRVADLGAGGGYFTFRLAEAVGESGVVYAIDVDGGMLRDLARRAAGAGIENVRTVHAAADDPSLPERVDLMFLSNSYHHIPDRLAYFRRATGHLRPGGRIAIVEGKREGFLARVFGHATAPETIRSAMDAAAYRLVDEERFLGRQSFHVFAPWSAEAPGGGEGDPRSRPRRPEEAREEAGGKLRRPPGRTGEPRTPPVECRGTPPAPR